MPLLVVENGQGGALRYRARMTVRGETRHTDVCVVLPHLPSYEHWPHLSIGIELRASLHSLGTWPYADMRMSAISLVFLLCSMSRLNATRLSSRDGGLRTR